MAAETDSEYVDPRSNITHTIDSGQVYTDSRTDDSLVLVFSSDDVALLRDEDGHHRLETRTQFENNVGGSRYSLQSDPDQGFSESSAVRKLESLRDQYEGESGRTAAHKCEAMAEAIDLVEHNGRADDNETVQLTEIDGIGETAASSLRAAGFSTKGDVRAADTDEIESVDHMGEKNTQALIDEVTQNE